MPITLTPTGPMRYLAYCNTCQDGINTTLTKAQKWVDKHETKDW